MLLFIFVFAGFYIAFEIHTFWNHGANPVIKMVLSIIYALTGYFASWMVSALLYAKSRGIDLVSVLIDHSRNAEVTYTAVGVWTAQILFAYLVFNWLKRAGDNVQKEENNG